VTSKALQQRVADVRRFNRFYTHQIGLLQETLLKSEFSLTETRVLYELSRASDLTASALIRQLGLDAGYLSRILRRLEQLGLVRRSTAEHDGRQSFIQLTAAGRKTFTPLENASSADVQRLLERLPDANQERLVGAMRSIEGLINGASDATSEAPVELHAHRPGDLGWVIQRHGEIYAQEYGWNAEFEALIANLCANFIKKLKPARERCWIAERGGERLGCVFLVEESKTVGRLRMLLVDPAARGLGLGSRLVDECLAFARSAGYRKVVLWTNDVLVSARHIYERAGFRLLKEEKHTSFGKDLVSQDWELPLQGPPAGPRSLRSG
jgi:DNA-binding MarR family transcriptional regulator/N-acetylglutamate synthase-like GNAT family acetyltransferase